MEGRDKRGRFVKGVSGSPHKRFTHENAGEMARRATKVREEEKAKRRSMKEWAKAYGETAKKKKMDDGSTVEVTNDQETVAVLYKISQDETNPAAAVRAAEALAKLKDEYSININMAEAEENRPEIEIE